MSTLSDILASLAVGYILGRVADALTSYARDTDGRWVRVTVDDRELRAFIGGAS